LRQQLSNLRASPRHSAGQAVAKQKAALAASSSVAAKNKKALP